MKSKRGRPPKKKSERKSEALRLPVTAEQKAEITAAAQRAGQDFAAWARDILLREAQQLTAHANPNG